MTSAIGGTPIIFYPKRRFVHDAVHGAFLIWFARDAALARSITGSVHMRFGLAAYRAGHGRHWLFKLEHAERYVVCFAPDLQMRAGGGDADRGVRMQVLTGPKAALNAHRT